jgi:outer membrane protein
MPHLVTTAFTRFREGRPRKLAVCCALLLAGSWAGVAVADDAVDGAPAAADPVHDSSAALHVAAGVGVLDAPRYPGSDRYYIRVLPGLNLEYGRFFLGGMGGNGSPVGLGAYLYRDRNWQLGVGLGGDVRKPREETDAPVLRGWGNIASTARGSLFGNFQEGWFNVHGYLSQDIAGKHEGLLASLYVGAVIHPLPSLTLSAGPEVIWANSSYSQTFFGLTPSQATIAGIAPYTAKAGIDSVRVQFGADYRIDDHWIVGTHLTDGRLQGDAADSPVTVDKSQHSVVAFLLYRFR